MMDVDLPAVVQTLFRSEDDIVVDFHTGILTHHTMVVGWYRGDGIDDAGLTLESLVSF
jgi:hypothetical protein